MRLFFRLQILIFLLSLLLLGIMLLLAPVLESRGTLNFVGLIGYNAYDVFVDYDSHQMHMQEMSRPGLNSFAYVAAGDIYFWDGSEMQIIDHEPTIHPILGRWNAQEDAIFLAYRINDDAALGWLDEDTGEIFPITRYEGFKLGFGSFAPNGRYFLLREEGLVRPIPTPQAMLLIDSETLAMIEFGTPVFAYWSPDSRYLALGYKEEERYESRIERYELATGERFAYPVVASQEDTPFFNDNGFRSNGVLWSPDSQKLVVLNRDTESLAFLSLDGVTVEVTGGRITPLRWSPDSRFLLGIGYANGEVGAFVVNATTGEFHRLQSPVLLQDALSDFAWSPNSRYIAVLTHSNGILFEQRLVLYDTQGQMVGNPVDLSLPRTYATSDGSLRWLD